MSYYFNKTLNLSFDKALAGVTEELKKEGFGILTDIDVKAGGSVGNRPVCFLARTVRHRTASYFQYVVGVRSIFNHST